LRASPANRSLMMAVTIAVATAILFAGVAYAVVRPVTYQSEATMVFVPTPKDPKDLASILDSFARSGTAGTYVELLASDDTLKRAGNPPVTVEVSSIPDTRVLRIATSSEDKNVVQPALRSLLSAAGREKEKLLDVWDLRLLQAPSAPAKGGTSTKLIVIATIMLAAFGALAAWTLLRRYGGPERLDRRRADSPRAEALAASDWLTRETPRYPTSR
jgi:hypothetical protein